MENGQRYVLRPKSKQEISKSMNDVLKPKSKEDLSKFIKEMPAYYFLYKFKNYDIKGIKMSFKRKFLHMMINGFKRNDLVYTFIYLSFLITWVTLGLVSTNATLPKILLLVKYFAMSFCLLHLFVMYASIILKNNVERFIKKKTTEYVIAMNNYRISIVKKQRFGKPDTEIMLNEFMSFEQFVMDRESYQRIILQYI